MSLHEAPTILIAEDSSAIRSILSFLLRARGYRVIECADGVEALDRVRSDRPDLIVLDVLMPGPNGFEVCQALKTDPTTRSIPVLILTSVTQGTGKGDEHWKSLSGANDFMTKPFKAAELHPRIARLLEEAARSSRPEPHHSAVLPPGTPAP